MLCSLGVGAQATRAGRGPSGAKGFAKMQGAGACGAGLNRRQIGANQQIGLRLRAAKGGIGLRGIGEHPCLCQCWAPSAACA